MPQTSRLLFLVMILCAILVGLTMFWLAVLPSRLADKLSAGIERRTGLHMKHGVSGLSFAGGPTVYLNAVTLSERSSQGAPTVQTDRITARISFLALLGASPDPAEVTLENPAFNLLTDKATHDASFEASSDNAPAAKMQKPIVVVIHNGSLKWRDAERQASFAVTDLNGRFELADDGSATLRTKALYNGKLTQTEISVDQFSRLRREGSPADVTLTSGQNNLAFTGRARLNGGLSFDGRLSVEGPELRPLLNWLGLGLDGFDNAGRTQFESALSLQSSGAELKQLKLQVDDIVVNGEAQLDFTRQRPAISATLTANAFDFGRYSQAKNADPKAAGSSLVEPWREKSWQFGDLAKVDAALTLTAEKLVVSGLQTGPANLDLKLRDGKLDLTLASDKVADGRAKAHLTLQQQDGVPAFALEVEAENVEARNFLYPLTGFAALQGIMSLRADLSAEGDSAARLISTLSGKIETALNKGHLDGVELLSLLAGKSRGWQWAEGKVTALADASARFQLADGIAQIEGLNGTAGPMTLQVDGEIDVLRQNLDLILRPKVSGVGKLPVQLAVSGAWQNPDLATDIDPAKVKPKALLKTGKKAIKKLFGN